MNLYKGVEELDNLLNIYPSEQSELYKKILHLLEDNNSEEIYNILKLENIIITLNDIENIISLLRHLFGMLLTKPFNIENSFNAMKERDWSFFYIYVDIHGTILEPDYGGLAKKYYPMAEETLKYLSDRKDVSLVLYTCSHKSEISEYLDFFTDSGIEFDGINHMPVENTRGGDFTDKPYFNVLLEDKAGFIGEKDWSIVKYIFEKYPIIND